MGGHLWGSSDKAEGLLGPSSIATNPRWAMWELLALLLLKEALEGKEEHSERDPVEKPKQARDLSPEGQGQKGKVSSINMFPVL